MRTVTAHLGPTDATVDTDHEAVLDYLRHFYPLTDGAASGDWTVEAVVGPVNRAMTLNRWGVGYAADPRSRRLRLRARSPHALAVTARTCVREVLVDYCERRRYVMLHASAVYDDRRVLVVVGDRGGGKTTLALTAVLRHGMRYLANDHLIVYLDPATGPTTAASPAHPAGPAREPALVLTPLPGPIAVKVGTYLDLADRLPPPFDTEGVDLDAYRAMPRAERHRSPERVIFTYRGLGQPHPAVVELGAAATGPTLLVALAGFAGADRPALEPAADPVTALLGHVRTDWMYDPRRNQRYLPRRERRPPAYDADARRLVRALAERATVVRYRHHGDPAPLLDHAGK